MKYLLLGIAALIGSFACFFVPENNFVALAFSLFMVVGNILISEAFLRKNSPV